MRKQFIPFICLLPFFSCKKEKIDLAQTPVQHYKFLTIYTLTPSGATLYYEFTYTGSTLTNLYVTNTNTGEKFFRHDFIYDKDKLIRVETYRTTGTISTPERRLLVFYTGSLVTKIERYYYSNGTPLLSSFITYTYNNDKMIRKVSAGQQSWGEQIVCRSDYSYDASGNISNVTMEYPSGGPLVIRLTPSYTNKENTLLDANPPLAAMIWDLTNPNFFTSGFDEVLLFSKNYVTGFKREINGSVRDFNFIMEFDQKNMPGRIYSYPDIFTNSSDPVFHDMRIAYILR